MESLEAAIRELDSDGYFTTVERVEGERRDEPDPHPEIHDIVIYVVSALCVIVRGLSHTKCAAVYAEI